MHSEYMFNVWMLCVLELGRGKVTPTNNPASRLLHHDGRAGAAGRQDRAERYAARRDGRGHHRLRDRTGYGKKP